MHYHIFRYLPQVAVNNVVVSADYKSIKQQACKDGSSASVCQ